MVSETTDLIEHQRLDAIVEQYTEAQNEIREGLRLLASARARLAATIGEDYNGICDHQKYRDTLDALVADDEGPQRCARNVQRNAWRYILDHLQIWAIMSEGAKKQLMQQLDENKLPEITHENVFGTLQSFMGNAGTLFEDCVKEVFRWLRPWRDDYKTNRKYSIGPKVIITSAVGGYSMNYYNEQNFRALDNVFHRLDGKGSPKYPADLVTIVNNAIHNKERSAETPYFRCKWFGNGNIHITFLRPDLLKNLNHMAGDHTSVPGPERTKSCKPKT